MKIKESGLRRIIREELRRSPITEAVHTSPGDPYEYRSRGNSVWHARRKQNKETGESIPTGSRGRWVPITTASTIEKLNRRYIAGASASAATPTPTSASAGARTPTAAPSQPSPDFPFTSRDQIEGNRFRAWMHRQHPEAVAKSDLDLDIQGSPSNRYMKQAWERYGGEYMRSQSASEEERIAGEEQAAVDAETAEYEQLSWLEKRKKDFGDWWDTGSGDTGDTGDTGLGGDDDDSGDEYGDDEVVYHENLPFSDPGTKMKDEDLLKQGQEVKGVWRCDSTHCAQYVSDTLDSGQGNAWHAHTYTNPTLESAFNDSASQNKDNLASIFTDLNREGGRGSDSDVKRAVTSVIPPKSRWGDLQIGDVVGMYYHPSDHHSTAFFEGGSGYSLSKNSEVAGPFFIRKDTGEPWSRSDLGQDVEFVPGSTLSGGKGFGMNTHLGFVGAKYDGEPIIFHNIHGRVDATPLRAMGRTSAIVWAKTPSQQISEFFQKKKSSSLNYLIESSNKAEIIDTVLKEIRPSAPKLAQMLKVSQAQFELLLATAILVGDRESDLGTGDRYKYHPKHGNIVQTAASELNKVWRDMTGINISTPNPLVGMRVPGTQYKVPEISADTSVGPTQIKYGTAEADLPPEYREEIGVTRPHDLSDMTKAVLAAVGLLAMYYQRSVKIGLSTSRPGVNLGHRWTSSGRAALDMAIAAYNGGAGRISNYCGSKKEKSKCKKGDAGWVRNYIPASKRFGMGYVDEVTKALPSMHSKVKTMMRSRQT